MRTRTKTKPRLSARNADRHVLYQESVQAPETDARFLARLYRRIHGAPATVFREDFCGTAILSCHWVRLRRWHRAVGVDLDAATLAWGRRHNLAALDADQRRRLRLVRDDVRNVRAPRADIVAAMNFSYSVFKTRAELGAYVRNAYRSLRPGGLLVMDAWGGPKAQERLEERRRLKGFTYVWDQAAFDPVSHEILCKIHFEFRDGTRLRNAFVYDWRLWTLPELRELMDEAGFEDVHVLWEGTDRRTGSGNGVFRRVERGGDEESWIAYVVGRRP